MAVADRRQLLPGAGSKHRETELIIPEPSGARPIGEHIPTDLDPLTGGVFCTAKPPGTLRGPPRRIGRRTYGIGRRYDPLRARCARGGGNHLPRLSWSVPWRTHGPMT